MRSIWKGLISFGLVNIPVRMYSATEEKTVRFHLLHGTDFGRLRTERLCTVDDQPVPWEEVVRGFEYEKNRYVAVTDEELEQLPVGTSHAIQILDFVDLAEIDPVYYKKTYYLEPDEGAGRSYALLRQAMLQAGKVAIAKVTLREKEHLCAVRVFDEALVVEMLFYADEVRPARSLPAIPAADVELPERELEMAVQLVRSLAADFQPDRYRDEYREALLDLLRKKAEGEPIHLAPRVEAPRVTDLMEALRKSVEQAKEETKAGRRGRAA